MEKFNKNKKAKTITKMGGKKDDLPITRSPE